MSEIEKSNSTKSGIQVYPVEDAKLLIPVLEQRLPKSCFIYNQAIISHKFPTELKFYTLSKEINPDTWIVTKYFREDYACGISISASTSIMDGTEKIPEEIKEFFCSDSLINWSGETFWLVAIDKALSTMMFDIVVNIKGKLSEFHPSVLYYMSNENALKLNISSKPEIEVNRLDPDRDTDFIFRTWNYATEGSDIVIRKSIKANASAGVFKKTGGECISGVIINGDGLLHCLYTLPEFRGKGYAKLTMLYCFNEFAKDGGIPCATVEIDNKRSLAFHDSLGAKPASIVNFIQVRKLDID